jgi:putative membrane-bound dehydrogenase-like protein
MPGPSPRFALPISSIHLLLPAALLVAMHGCAPAPEPDNRPSPASTAPVEAVRLDSAEVVRVSAAQAAEQARVAREEVSVKLADGFDLRLWAADPLFTDPVSIDVDHQGRVYVTSTDRRRSSDIDIRNHRDWMTASISFQSVDDRRAFLHREMAPELSERNDWQEDVNGDGSRDWRDLTVKKESLFRLEDTSGDGLADLSTLLIRDFHTEVTDVAGGVLVHGNDIFMAVSPDFWRLRDEDGDGTLDTKQAIASGFHTHIAFGGHGMSGATLGPDGRIYWSIGDPGLNTVGPDGKEWKYPNQGVIVRANPDGSEFEVFAAGMRNTHEFAFDELGNLISVDNDGDHPGETERVVYITNGQDSGWRINWQFGKYTDPDNNEYKVWMDEGMYRPRFPEQAAWFTPPIAAYHAGPAGMVYNPGTALSERWRKHFFVAEFTGSAANSKIHAFALNPSGAGFTLGEDTTLVSGILTTGIEFGPDGSLYVADWIDGWGTKDRGRVWKLDTPAAAATPERATTRALLAAGFADRSAAELSDLLGNADMRVRLEAQFELAGRGDAKTLLAAARRADAGLARLHGLWGIEQIARRDTRQAALLTPFLRDADAEVRAQAAKMLGDVRYAPAAAALIPLLQDAAPRPRFFAAEALGRIEYHPAVQPIIDMLAANDDRDVYLRAAGTLALARIGDAAPVAALASHPSRGLRIAAVVALRRMKDPGVARFLDDADEYIVTEAARAINDDGSIEAALPALAGVLDRNRFSNEALVRRAINANLRLGTAEAAQRVAAYAARTASPEPMRVDAVGVLGVWPKPSPLDRVDGIYRGSSERDTTLARAAVAPLMEPILASGNEAVKVALLETIGRLRMTMAAPALLARVQSDASPRVRESALRALAALGTPEVEEALRASLADQAAPVRMAALELLPALRLADATAAELLTSVIAKGSTQEKQSAIATLGRLEGPRAREALAGLVTQLTRGDVPAEVQLEVEEAVDSSGSAPLRAALDRRHAANGTGSVAAFGAALAGGNAQRGRRVVQSEAAQCTRCHSIEVAGAEVGPNLRGVGTRLTREQLLQALIEPNARIAPGFFAPSAMPPMGSLLSKREIRDVVEYLSTLK